MLFRSLWKMFPKKFQNPYPITAHRTRAQTINTTTTNQPAGLSLPVSISGVRYRVTAYTPDGWDRSAGHQRQLLCCSLCALAVARRHHGKVCITLQRARSKRFRDHLCAASRDAPPLPPWSCLPSCSACTLAHLTGRLCAMLSTGRGRIGGDTDHA